MEIYHPHNIVALIMQGAYMDCERIEMGNGTVSEELQSELANWDCTYPALFQPILINAPTGRGKSTFILSDLAEHAKEQSKKYAREQGQDEERGKYVLLLSNRYALSLQQKVAIIRKNGLPSMSQKIMDGLWQFDNILVLTYQSVLQTINNIYEFFYLKHKLGFVVFDEAHFFLSDAVFNVYTYTIYDTLIRSLPEVRRIYMSATPDDVKPLIGLKERALLESYIASKDARLQYKASANTARKIAEYYFPNDYSFVNLSFLDNLDTLIQECKKSSEKWLIFVSSKENGRYLKKQIGDAEFIDASTKKTNPTIITNLINNEMFTQRVLISTSTLDNGVNFKDTQLKHIVVDSIDQIQMIQMLGRKRRNSGEIVNLYVMQKDLKQISEYYNSAQESLSLVANFCRDRRVLYQNYWGSLTESQQNLFGWKNGMPFVNEYSYYQLALLLGKCEVLKATFKTEGNRGFAKEVSSWFNKEYNSETEDVLYHELKVQVQNCVEQYIENANFSKEAFDSLEMTLKKIIKPLPKSEINIKESTEKEDRTKANVNKIIKYFSLLYHCTKSDNQ